MIQLHDEKHPAPEQIKSILIKGNPLVLQLTGHKTPSTGLEAKFSVYHAAAISLIRGRGGVKEFSDEAARDPAVLRLRSLVTVDTSPDVRSDEVFITVQMDDGTVLTKHVNHALGTLENPMSDKQLEGKFRSLAEGILSPAKIDGAVDQLWHLSKVSSVGAILEAASLH
jgi:2-methylcitrate dehydratase PrpD